MRKITIALVTAALCGTAGLAEALPVGAPTAVAPAASTGPTVEKARVVCRTVRTAGRVRKTCVRHW